MLPCLALELQQRSRPMSFFHVLHAKLLNITFNCILSVRKNDKPLYSTHRGLLFDLHFWPGGLTSWLKLVRTEWATLIAMDNGSANLHPSLVLGRSSCVEIKGIEGAFTQSNLKLRAWKRRRGSELLVIQIISQRAESKKISTSVLLYI